MPSHPRALASGPRRAPLRTDPAKIHTALRTASDWAGARSPNGTQPLRTRWRSQCTAVAAMAPPAGRLRGHPASAPPPSTSSPQTGRGGAGRRVPRHGRHHLARLSDLLTQAGRIGTRVSCLLARSSAPARSAPRRREGVGAAAWRRLAPPCATPGPHHRDSSAQRAVRMTSIPSNAAVSDVGPAH